MTWERDGVADVVQTGKEEDEPLKAHAKTAVWHGTKSAGVSVPAVRRRVQLMACHLLLQDGKPLLPKTPAHELADARHKQINRSDRLPWPKKNKNKNTSNKSKNFIKKYVAPSRSLLRM